MLKHGFLFWALIAGQDHWTLCCRLSFTSEIGSQLTGIFNISRSPAFNSELFRDYIFLLWGKEKLAGLEIIKRSSFIQHGDYTREMEECENNSCSAIDSKTDESSFTSEVVEELDTGFVEETLSNSDNLEVESGVESVTGDVTEAELFELNSYFALGDDNLSLQLLADLDLTTEQAQETLKYFSEYMLVDVFVLKE